MEQLFEEALAYVYWRRGLLHKELDAAGPPSIGLPQSSAHASKPLFTSHLPMLQVLLCAILAVGAWWLLTDVLGVMTTV